MVPYPLPLLPMAYKAYPCELDCRRDPALSVDDSLLGDGGGLVSRRGLVRYYAKNAKDVRFK